MIEIQVLRKGRLSSLNNRSSGISNIPSSYVNVRQCACVSANCLEKYMAAQQLLKIVYALDIKFWVRWYTCSMWRMLLPYYLLFLISIILFLKTDIRILLASETLFSHVYGNSRNIYIRTSVSNMHARVSVLRIKFKS